jgi:RNA polymerase sigma-70 factor (ECF subfamily)
VDDMTVATVDIPRQRCAGGLDDAERALLAALRDGNEELFLSTVRTWWPAMISVASRYVRTRTAAEDVVQDTWVAVLRGLGRFEGRSSLRTWVFHILLNRARSAAAAERRVLPFSEAFPEHDSQASGEPAEPQLAVETEAELPEPAALAAELRGQLGDAVNRLPDRQRTVLVLRDVHGYPPGEVCRLLGVSTGNQRVLLHRGRAQLRNALGSRSVN